MSSSQRYAEAGVDIEAGDRIKKQIAKTIAQTHSSRVLHKEGAFGALFSLSGLSFQKPVLVSSVDGVGTKVKIAVSYGYHKGIGIDIVNHSINDILTCGASPLFFLDYYACAKQEDDVVLQIMEGMSEACRAAGMALIGGETAQMPDVYAPCEYDLAGCIVGMVDEDKMIDGKHIQPGDSIIGFPSSGLHTNGYTLARTVLLKEKKYRLEEKLPGLKKSLGEALLEPHKSYLQEIIQLRQSIDIKGIAHITGGGFEGNIGRILPEGCQAKVYTGNWNPLPIFQIIQSDGSVSQKEMYKVFNMGIGLVIFVSQEDGAKIVETHPGSIRIGEVGQGSGVELIHQSKVWE